MPRFARSIFDGAPYAIYCATLDRRKNHQILYRAMREMDAPGHRRQPGVRRDARIRCGRSAQRDEERPSSGVASRTSRTATTSTSRRCTHVLASPCTRRCTRDGVWESAEALAHGKRSSSPAARRSRRHRSAPRTRSIRSSPHSGSTAMARALPRRSTCSPDMATADVGRHGRPTIAQCPPMTIWYDFTTTLRNRSRNGIANVEWSLGMALLSST